MSARLTPRRRAVLHALQGSPGRHFTAEELAADLPDVNLATVYRALDVLVEDGLARRTRLARDREHYEAAGAHRHHHLVCAGCGAVAHVHDDALGALGRRLRTATGWELGPAELTLEGRCPACAGPIAS